MGTLTRGFLSDFQRTAMIAWVVALCAALLFSFLVYPILAAPLASQLANDGYDQLARGLYYHGTLSFYPSPQPTVLRGPLYPAFVAALLSLGEQTFPMSVQIAQAVLHAFSTLLCFLIARHLWDVRRAGIAALVCALNPFLIWYTPRVVTEIVATFLFTLVIYLYFRWCTDPSRGNTLLMGLALGLAALCKATFLPFIVIVPLLAVFGRGNRQMIRRTLFASLIALLVVIPWTMRNYLLTEKFIPVHTLLGFNIKQGDCFAENYFSAPLNYMQLVDICQPYTTAEGDTVVHWELEKGGVLGGIALERELTVASLHRYQEEPEFLLKKVALNFIMFWTISGSETATIVTSVLQIPLLIGFILVVGRLLRLEGTFSARAVPVWCLAVYVASHLPIYALARFGSVLIPVMISYVAGLLRSSEDPVQ